MELDSTTNETYRLWIFAVGPQMNIPNSTISSAIGPVARLLEASLKGARGLPAFLRKQAELSDFLGSVSARYAAHCSDVYKNVRVLSMQKPVELQQIYTQVRLSEGTKRGKNATEEEILSEILTARRDDDNKLPALEVAKSERRVVLLGRPGSGKSTFLKYFLLSRLRDSDGITQIPIIIPLNQIAGTSFTVQSHVAKIFQQCGVNFSELLTDSLLKSGRLKLLIDGLDELRSEERNRVIGEINTLVKTYRNCDFVITCRSSAYEFWFEEFSHYEIEPFGVNEIKYFIENWFEADLDKSTELKKQIVGNTRLRDLCSSPLMITIVCIGFEIGTDVSNNRAEIYKDAIEALLKKWDATRSIFRDNIYKEITSKRREDLLSDLAARTFVNGEVVFPESRAVEIVEDFLATIPTTDDRSLADESLGVLQAIESQHGLIDKRSTNLWSFSHLTFQEYFTARYAAYRDESLRANIVKRYIDRPEWREVIVLTAGLLPNADEYVLEILGAMSKLGFGQFFIRQINNEIEEARRSIAHKKHDASQIFSDPPESQIYHKARSLNLRVVDGGIKLDLIETRTVLDRFRITVAQRLGGGVHGNIFNSNVREFANFFKLSHVITTMRPNSMEEYSNYVIGSGGIVAGIVSRTIMVHMMDHLSDSKIDQLKIDLPSQNQFDRQFALAKRISIIFAIELFKSNEGLEDEISRALASDSIFELTDRKYMYLVPECLSDCSREVRKILDKIDYTSSRKVIEHFDVFTSSPQWVAAKYVENFKEDIHEAMENLLTQMADSNARESAKLRSFVAGETLAELLLSQVFLTSKVREAAVNTLDNLINNIPKPPEGPTTHGDAKRATG